MLKRMTSPLVMLLALLGAPLLFSPNFSGFSTGYLRAGRGLRGILAELVFSL